MNYPIVTAGLVLGPRGIGTMGVMLIVGRLIGRVDTRLLLGLGPGHRMADVAAALSP
jgi:DHA2 family multidrug resistance protein